MRDVGREPDFFVEMERLAHDDAPEVVWKRMGRFILSSGAVHALILLAMVVGPLGSFFASDAEDYPGSVLVRFYEPGATGPGGGGGGGGSGGKRPTAYIPARIERPESEPVVETPRKAPVAPRKPRPLRFDELDVPDLPDETTQLFAGVFSPDAREFPGLSLTDSRDFGGLDRERSSGTGGGIGGGKGTGVGTGEGWGVGPGRGGGFGGGDYRPGAWDIEPQLVYKPPSPEYPAMAREKMVRGEVMLEVLVKLDGSTEVLRVLKSLPYCVEAAKENAKLWRWKPALKDGKPVEAPGIITVTFELFARG